MKKPNKQNPFYTIILPQKQSVTPGNKFLSAGNCLLLTQLQKRYLLVLSAKGKLASVSVQEKKKRVSNEKMEISIPVWMC